MRDLYAILVVYSDEAGGGVQGQGCGDLAAPEDPPMLVHHVCRDQDALLCTHVQCHVQSYRG